jgi:hypothetical protein
MAFYHRAYEILRMFWIASFLAMTERSTLSSLRGTKQTRNIKKEETYNNEGCTTLAGILDCFVPRNDERASDDGGMTGERLFAGVLDCFVPRNDERASDERRE